MYQIISVTIALLLAQQLFAQTANRACRKNADCQSFAFCASPDHWNHPHIWPPCPYVGNCTCIFGYIQASPANITCVQILNLNLYDPCSNRVNEQLATPQQRCNGTHVICNAPVWLDRGRGFCELAPVPTVVPAPVVTTARTCETVGFLEFCDSRTACCDAGTGLTCQNKGPNSTYAQCHCSRVSDIFDSSLGLCRPRVYGDICVVDAECDSKLISNSGFECRFGRCRCAIGFEPYENMFWNATSHTTYTRTICLSSEAVTWVPTSQSCTMDPHLFADASTTRVCHPNAFCHLCQHQRSTYTVGQSIAVNGTCREYACSGNDQCGSNGRCNNWGAQVDPPCERSTCDCNWDQGYYKDRFSRCSAYDKLELGDRCIVPDQATQLWNWYPNNEDWDEGKGCVDSGKGEGGYAGYNWGVVKCNLPLIEDRQGNCIRNDDLLYQWQSFLDYDADCDDRDNRYPLKRCDASRGLVCERGKCRCGGNQTCTVAGHYAGCNNNVTSSPNFWDGQTCRARTFGDQCTTNSECCGGSCLKGQCGCPTGLTAVQYSVVADIQNGDNRIRNRVVTLNYCFRQAHIALKGQHCHLDPTTYNCAANQGYGFTQTPMPLFVCSPGFVCMRCPQDLTPDDQDLGLCRAFRKIPDTHPSPVVSSGAANAWASSSWADAEIDAPSNPWGSWSGGWGNVPSGPGGSWSAPWLTNPSLSWALLGLSGWATDNANVPSWSGASWANVNSNDSSGSQDSWSGAWANVPSGSSASWSLGRSGWATGNANVPSWSIVLLANPNGDTPSNSWDLWSDGWAPWVTTPSTPWGSWSLSGWATGNSNVPSWSGASWANVNSNDSSGSPLGSWSGRWASDSAPGWSGWRK